LTAAAVIACSDPERLARAMGRHFGHKVHVEQSGPLTRVFVRSGRFEMEPGDGRLAVRATAASADELADVMRIAENHLARFARPESIDIDWNVTDSGGPLERAALDWIAPYPNAKHLARTRDWLLELEPSASPALRLAALTHDMERNVPGGPAPDPGNPDYHAEHAQRSARIVREWLLENGATEELAAEVQALVAAHEVGGSPEADLLQAADSLSFLEVNRARPAAWVREGRCDAAGARARLREMFERIGPEPARAAAQPLLERAERELAAELEL
jgi:hypothetical protein